MNNIKKSIIAASIIETMFAEYEAEKLDKTGEALRKRAGRYMRKRAKSNPREFREAISEAYVVWRDTIKHFEKEKLRIEVKSTIAEVFNYFEDVLKSADITSKLIEKFTINCTDDAEAEHNSGKVVNYMVERLGLQVRENNFHTRFTILKQNRIIKGGLRNEKITKR